MYQNDFLTAVKEKARGNWLSILPAIDNRLQDAVKHVGNHVANPVFGGTNGFRLFKDAPLTGGGVANPDYFLPNGFEVLMYTLNDTFNNVLYKVAKEVGINKNWKEEQVNPVQRPVLETPKLNKSDLDKRRKLLRQVWKSSLSLTDINSETARIYLMKRGLDLNKLDLGMLSKTMRFVPLLGFYHNNKFYGSFPAIVTLISYPDGTAASIHRTYLDKKGNKLNLTIDNESIDPKKMMARCSERTLSGGVIRLGEATETIHLAEGIETTLSISQAKNVNVWCSVNAALLGSFEPPKETKRIFVWGDKDRTKVDPRTGRKSNAGLDSAMKLAERMESRNISVVSLFPNMAIPENQKGVDWNDVLNQYGENEFPSIGKFCLL